MKILLIEDNTRIVKGLEYSFKKEGYDFSYALDINKAKRILDSEEFDVVVLDMFLPDGNGLDFYQEVIKDLKLPTVVLTAVDDEEKIVKALDMGCDDYITKPFSQRELQARIKRILARHTSSNKIKSGNIEYDVDKMEIYKDGEIVTVSSLELKILNLLFTNIDRVVTRETILDRIWEWTGNDVDDHTVTVYLNRIRSKIGDDVVKTIKGVGYRIDGK